MTLSLEELGPAVEATPHQGPVDTATAAAAATAQPTASLGAAASPSEAGAQTGGISHQSAEAAVAASDAIEAQSGVYELPIERCSGAGLGSTAVVPWCLLSQHGHHIST